MMHRLPPVPGEWLDRTRVLSFSFEGRRYHGFAGDTIASALAAQGVMIFGRSAKQQRARGILGGAEYDVNALFQIGRGAQMCADTGALAAGMCIRRRRAAGR